MRATMSAPMLGCSRSTTHSSSSSGPGFESTAPATAIVPTSCSRPARRRSAWSALGQAELATDELGELGDADLVLVGNALAHGGGAGERGGDAHGLARGRPPCDRIAPVLAGAGCAGPLRFAAASATSAVCSSASTVVPAWARAPASRDGHVHLAAGRAQRLARQRRGDLGADAAQCVGVAQIRHEHGEAATADVRDRVVRAHAVREAAGELAQDGVADRVAAALVELAQAIDVEQHERGARVLALRARELAACDVQQVMAVEEPGRRVDARAPLGLLACELQSDAGALALGDVADDDVVGDGVVARVRPGTCPDPALDAVEAEQPVGRLGRLALHELLG